MFEKRFNQITKIIAATLLAALFITFLLQIFSRYVLNSPFGWTLELCRILWVWIVFFCCAFLVQEKDHVKFNLIYSASSKKSKFIVNINLADSIQWRKLRGVGAKRSIHILNYKNALGGFVHISQVNEVFSINDSLFKSFKRFLNIKDSSLEKLI